MRLTWRLALDRQRANRRRAAQEFSARTTAPSTPDDSAEAAERAAEVWEAIDALPRKLRLVIVLASIERLLARQHMKEHLE